VTRVPARAHDRGREIRITPAATVPAMTSLHANARLTIPFSAVFIERDDGVTELFDDDIG
jgi:hypothetical protein